MAETEYVFEDSNKKKGGIGTFIWNSETKEFLGRDGASWGKVSLFYAVFYTCLASFFVGMLAVFVSFMPRDRPTYYGESSTMNARGLNPGLGFRPMIDVENDLIAFNPQIIDNPKTGYEKYVRNLKHFLDAKYAPIPNDQSSDVIKCVDGLTYDTELEKGRSCEFDSKTLFKDTDCTEENSFGYKTHRPCVLIKLNKIISWTPVNAAKSNGVEIRCAGESSADRDNLKNVTFHSASALNSVGSGFIDRKFFPFFAQKTYRQPFLWAQFDIPSNTMVNIECKAYAENIDNSDRLNRRGLTRFSLYVTNK